MKLNPNHGKAGIKHYLHSITQMFIYDINGIRKKLQETLQVAKDIKANIIIRNETKLKPSLYLNAPGYKVFRKDRNNIPPEVQPFFLSALLTDNK